MRMAAVVVLGTITSAHPCVCHRCCCRLLFCRLLALFGIMFGHEFGLAAGIVGYDMRVLAAHQLHGQHGVDRGIFHVEHRAVVKRCYFQGCVQF